MPQIPTPVRTVFREFIDALNNLYSLISLYVPGWALPGWGIALIAVFLCLPKGVAIWNQSIIFDGSFLQFGVLGMGRKQLVGLLLVVGATVCGFCFQSDLVKASMRAFRLKDQRPKLLEPVAEPRDPTTMDTFGCEKLDRNIRVGWQFMLKEGNCEVVIKDPDKASLNRHSYGIVMDLHHMTKLPPFGFNASLVNGNTNRIRVLIERKHPNEWCVDATTSDSDSPSSMKSFLQKDRNGSNFNTNCWIVERAPTSLLARLEFDGIHFRVSLKFLKDTYSGPGRISDLTQVSGVVDVAYLHSAPNANGLFAAIGLPDQIQPVWRIWLPFDYWRKHIVSQD